MNVKLNSKTMKNSYRKRLSLNSLLKHLLKFTFLLFFAFTIPNMVKSEIIANDSSVSITGSNITLQYVLQELERQTDFKCLYSNDEIGRAHV